jgi:hypothetical protein
VRACLSGLIDCSDREASRRWRARRRGERTTAWATRHHPRRTIPKGRTAQTQEFERDPS